ncbi:helix-turn-helix domain-containing protein [Testudinibacter sp. TR-2022]|uniref:AAA family ATPase n=1 Tax=Testudinibacter sp. TR-2022 TaxID=2585029 RepID=UPI00111AC0E9|nr:AAA family ATPase [Testudinibacter sp. TR-2022]TNH04498.1 helix-turn-helix domain-containing protein [Pasteurellaceae bacterium Phil31]TNH11980.1 helix-turn-helix domain-containing protein [Testudinibacter sp. TR-2022]TNH12715.1 helix-turn-helix domain-containing protein [Testudinibacter sp. TR-2022]TNH13692.1 helix-turn-helix domain-containing protein [Testudinibacter sp. TR-2022]TNH17226.1 helix-turn-helix domain-containing protein [Testudinibacter sp. TR-2022]
MLALKQVLQQHEISQAELARQVGISPAALAQWLNHHILPTKQMKALKIKLSKVLKTLGIQTALADLLTESTQYKGEVSASAATLTEASTINEEATTLTEDELMLLAKQSLYPATKRHFSLFSNPFTDEVRSAEQVFTSPDVRYVREALFQTAKFGGFVAVVGESGAGKSTLRRDLIDRINAENLPVVVIEPYIIAMEDNDVKGKTLKASHIAEAIVSTLAPLENIKRSPEARFRQLHRVLKDSARAGNQHILIIEEAHSLPVPTLKHLKRFFELEDGFKKLLSIVLVGQPELKLKLSERNFEVREVVQRCEVVELAPLDSCLAQYIDWRLKAVNRKASDIFDKDALDMLRSRLVFSNSRNKTQTSLLYPLAVGNLITAAMNLAAELGSPLVTADVIKAV